MRLVITHKTHYTYEEEVNYALQKLRLTPRSTRNQKVLNWKTEITGGKQELHYLDHLGNHTELVSFKMQTRDLAITCSGEVETSDNAGVLGPHRGYAPLWYFLKPTELTRPGKNLNTLLKTFRKDAEDAENANEEIARLHDLSAFIGEEVKYEIGATTSESNVEEVLETGKGVCQDHTHLFVAAARELGHPARYVSGYLHMKDKTDQDACHAWAEAYIEHLGWVGFDVSNGISPDENYIRIALGRDYAEAAPIAGLRLGESEEQMVVSLQVQQ